MQDLIKVELNENQEQVVSGRELHKFLEVKTKYKDWFPRMVEYGFSENIDFVAMAQKRATAQGNQTAYMDHVLKLDMAKELSMIQRTEKGKQARLYFIEVEKAWNSPEQIMARALQMADKQIDGYKKEIQEMKPKALFADAVQASNSSILVGELAKILKQNGVNIGPNQLFEWLRERGYLIRRKGESKNLPTQRSMDMGLFEIKKRTINNPDGSVRTTRTPKVTGRGQIYFVNKFKANDRELQRA